MTRPVALWCHRSGTALFLTFSLLAPSVLAPSLSHNHTLSNRLEQALSSFSGLVCRCIFSLLFSPSDTHWRHLLLLPSLSFSLLVSPFLSFFLLFWLPPSVLLPPFHSLICTWSSGGSSILQLLISFSVSFFCRPLLLLLFLVVIDGCSGGRHKGIQLGSITDYYYFFPYSLITLDSLGIELLKVDYTLCCGIHCSTAHWSTIAYIDPQSMCELVRHTRLHLFLQTLLFFGKKVSSTHILTSSSFFLFLVSFFFFTFGVAIFSEVSKSWVINFV